MTRPTAVFRSVSQALHVAYLMASLPVTQKSNTQALIERLLADAGVRQATREEGSLNFSGLTPMEVRGQCAMVRGAVRHHCTTMEAHAIHAWFGHQDSAEKIQGVSALRSHCAGTFTVDPAAAQLLIVWHIHAQGKLRDQVTERAIAVEQALSQSTVHRNIVAVSRVVSALRRGGMDRLEAMFQRDGLIDAEEVAYTA